MSQHESRSDQGPGRAHGLVVAWMLLLPVLGTGVAHGAESAGCPRSGARVFLTSSGVLTLNGREVEAGKLKAALEALKPVPTVICYSRQADRNEPHPSMVLVLDAIISTRIPIGFFTDGTFEERVELKP